MLCYVCVCVFLTTKKKMNRNCDWVVVVEGEPEDLHLVGLKFEKKA